MKDEHKHLENTYVEIPKDTVANWFKEAQEGSMRCYNRIDSKYCETYLQLRTEGWRTAERTKNAFNEMFIEMSKKLDKKDDDYKASVRENEKLIAKIHKLSAPKQ